MNYMVRRTRSAILFGRCTIVLTTQIRIDSNGIKGLRCENQKHFPTPLTQRPLWRGVPPTNMSGWRLHAPSRHPCKHDKKQCIALRQFPFRATVCYTCRRRCRRCCPSAAHPPKRPRGGKSLYAVASCASSTRTMCTGVTIVGLLSSTVLRVDADNKRPVYPVGTITLGPFYSLELSTTTLQAQD